MRLLQVGNDRNKLALL